jgi:hypothetical protein
MTHQLEKERKYAKLELGNFCEQFGYSPLKTIAPSRQRRKQQKLYKNNYKNNNSNKRNKSYKFYKNKPYKNYNFKSQVKNVGKQKDRTSVCYRYGKTGHFQKNCKVKKEINKIDISKYNIEQLKNKLSCLEPFVLVRNLYNHLYLSGISTCLGLARELCSCYFSIENNFTCIYACQESLLARELCIENSFFCFWESKEI